MFFKQHCCLAVITLALTLAPGIVHAQNAPADFNNLITGGKYQEAIVFAEKQLPPSSRTVDNWLDLATAYSKTNGAKEVILNCYLEAQKVNPSEPRVHFQLGMFHGATKNYTEALKYLQSSFLLKRDANTAEQIALCAASLGQWEKAKDAAETAIALNSALTECRPILVKLYLQENNLPAAIAQMEILIKQTPAALEKWKQLADCYEKAKMVDRLPVADSVIVSLDKNNTVSRSRYAQYALTRKDTTTALRLYKELALLSPGDPVSFKNLYLISHARKATEDATLYLKNYLVLDTANRDLHWQLGDLLYARKEFTTALESYRKAFKALPKTRGHYKQFADIVLQLKNENEAVSVINAAIQVEEADATMLAALGRIYQKSGQHVNAIKAFQETLKQDPRNLPVLGSLAECQAKSGDLKNAVITYEQIVLLNPKVTAEYKALGDIQLKLDKTDNAIASYRKYLESDKSDHSVAAIVGQHLFKNKSYIDAIKYLSMVTAPEARTTAFYIALGLSSVEVQDCKTAIDALSRVAASKPIPPIQLQILQPLAECYERTGNTAKAAETFQAYSRIPGISEPGIAFKIAVLREESDKSGALTVYLANIKSYPKDYRNYLRAGMLYAADPNALPKAIDYLKKASTMVDTIPILYRTLASVYGQLKDNAQELVALNRLLALEPKDPQTNRRVGLILAERKQFAKAVTSLEIALVAAPQDFDLIMLTANAYLELKKAPEALALLRRAKSLQPENPVVILKIIATATITGDAAGVEKEKTDLAEIDKKTILKDKKNIEAHVRLIDYYFTKKDFSSAFPLLKELAELTPKDAMVFKKLHDVAIQLNDKNAALNYLQRYLQIELADAKGFHKLAMLLVETKDTEGALNAYRTAFKLSKNLKDFYKGYIEIILSKKLEAEAITVIPEAIRTNEASLEAFLTLGDVYQKKGKYDDAIRVFQDALKIDPKNIVAMGALADCQAKNNDVKNAILSYEQLVLMKTNPGAEYKILGDLQLKSGKKDNAMESFQKSLSSNPSDQVTARIVGLYKYAGKKYKDAITYFEMVKNPSIQDAEYLVACGDCYYQTDFSKKTIELYTRARTMKLSESTMEHVLKILGSCYLKSNEPAKALEVFDVYTKMPKVIDPEAAYLSGFLREKTDRATAIKVYNANTIKYPKDYRNFLQLGLLLSNDTSNMKNSVSALRSASVLIDTLPVIWKTLAQANAILGDENGELAALQKLLALQPQNIEANKAASKILFKRKQIIPAITYLETVMMIAPTDVETMVLLADGYLQTKRQTQAMDLLGKAKNLDKKNIGVHATLYELYAQSNQLPKAEAEIKELIELTKSNKYRLLYANDLIAQKRNDEALKQISDIRASDPRNIDALMMRATIQKELKQYDEAIETYKDISYINENHVASIIERGDTYILMGQVDRAEQFFTKAQKLDPKNGLVELGFALVCKAQKNMSCYQDHLNKAKALDSKNARILLESTKTNK